MFGFSWCCFVFPFSSVAMRAVAKIRQSLHGLKTECSAAVVVFFLLWCILPVMLRHFVSCLFNFLYFLQP